MPLHRIVFIPFIILAVIKALADLIASMILKLKNTSAFLTCIVKTFLFQDFELSNTQLICQCGVYTSVEVPLFIRMTGKRGFPTGKPLWASWLNMCAYCTICGIEICLILI